MIPAHKKNKSLADRLTPDDALFSEDDLVIDEEDEEQQKQAIIPSPPPLLETQTTEPTQTTLNQSPPQDTMHQEIRTPSLTEDIGTEQSDQDLSQCMVNLKIKPNINKHLEKPTAPFPFQPLEYVQYDPILAKQATPRVNKDKSAENQAKKTTPAMTRKKRTILQPSNEPNNSFTMTLTTAL